MPSGLQLPDSVLRAREQLSRGREKLETQHRRGVPGIQLCAHLADLVDTVLLDLYEAALTELADDQLESRLALVPNGGYGRRDVAPYSDADLMLLYDPACEQEVAALARKLSRYLTDAGLQLGFSFRSPREAVALSLKDPRILTSLAESRYLGGSVKLYTRFAQRLRRAARRRARGLIDVIEAARREERRQYGETVYLLKPNIKRSRGGLRDLQLLRWIGFVRHGESEPDNLARQGALAAVDRGKLREAYQFLLRLRNEMHFHAGKSQDVLSRGEQVRIAEQMGYQGREGMLPVEQFMRDYFHHTSEVKYTVAHFIATARSRPMLNGVLAPLVTHRVEGDFRAGPWHIGATQRSLPKIAGDLSQVLRLMDLANRYGLRIDHRTWQAIRDEMMTRESVELTSEARRRFLSLISQPGPLGSQLRRLHELRVLERIIPAVRHARCLLQFNEYHKYTVDEHSLRAIERATEFVADEGTLGDVYRQIRDKQTLHLALLLHDLGKGFPEDHSEVGLRIAADTAQHLELDEQRTEVLKFLVHKHLVMAHLALRQDLNDEQLVVRFAFDVGSIEVLQMLYVLTCADLAAVGPGVLNNWKLELITQLYHRTRRHLSEESGSGSQPAVSRRRGDVLNLVNANGDDAEWWERHVEFAPPGYLMGHSPEQIVAELEKLRNLGDQEVLSWGRYLIDREVVEYTVCAHGEIVPGLFHRLTGAVSSKGNQILSAEIHTLADNLVLDRFYVHDLDFPGEPPAERLREIRDELTRALRQPTDEWPNFRRLWRDPVEEESSDLNHLPTRITFDNATSESATLLTIFAYDQLGLLYALTRTIFDNGLTVHVAKIGTYLDQVVDIFYVTDGDGRKVTSASRQAELRRRLLEAVEQDPVQTR